jgi:hypothetical protein
VIRLRLGWRLNLVRLRRRKGAGGKLKDVGIRSLDRTVGRAGGWAVVTGSCVHLILSIFQTAKEFSYSLIDFIEHLGRVY